MCSLFYPTSRTSGYVTDNQDETIIVSPKIQYSDGTKAYSRPVILTGVTSSGCALGSKMGDRGG